MLHKLTEEKQNAIIEAAVSVFGDKGFAAAGIGEIAKIASVSVGVIYKYYEDKEALFYACIDRSLDMLDQTLSAVNKQGGSLVDMINNLIKANIAFSKEHPHYIKMYHAITMGIDGADISGLARRIESESAHIYTEMITKARLEGVIRKDITPADFAFFFDNLMMLLHFSYACDYYKERMRIYVGEDTSLEEYDARVEEQLLRFIEGAFGITL